MATLINQKALITGATKGMGLAIAEKLASLGCHLLLAARDRRALDALKTALEQEHPTIQVQCLACDFSDSAQLKRLIQWMEHTAPDLDILINNVGIFRPVSLFEESEEDFELQMLINYHTPHLLSRAAGRNMQKNHKGHIFNISSIASRKPVASAATYTVTKYAVMGLTHVLREALRPYGVKVTEIIPGSTLTSSWEGTTVAADRFVLPTDIADAIASCLQMSDGANVDEIVVTPKFGNI
ncbi:SDR family oxidoreductase [Parapedobacter sp. ISTM3]|uniref:SDR family NAD(P)-dependent oxidoreductase n=1 Tax=Parapedobacter sp. ISTM3 TaxID=2800130 RepID=UPI001906B608|nr:SDR family oxidoreductase [Parapedobacter sp. ISTM3]MBK1438741.1 SDR family oxidoreductase [Parapedobacter sp. ISTM3]